MRHAWKSHGNPHPHPHPFLTSFLTSLGLAAARHAMGAGKLLPTRRSASPTDLSRAETPDPRKSMDYYSLGQSAQD